jgi:phenylacetate-CoA ligase
LEMPALTKILGAAPRYAALLRSQYWEPERRRVHIQTELAKILKAAARIPFYADRFNGAADLRSFARLPTLKRTDVSRLNASVRSLYSAGTRFLADSSSGSIGLPAEFLFDSAHQRGRYAARARYLRSYAWNPLARTIWHFTPTRGGEEPDADFARSRVFCNVRFMSVSADLAAQVSRVVDFDPLYISMYPSNLEGLLSVLEETGQKLPSLRRIFAGSEVLDDTLRDRTRQLLGVEIADHYGSTEAFLAWQCPKGGFHVNAEHVLIEILDDLARPVRPGKMGRVVVTTLENELMPLVRYEIGDYAFAAEGICRCGRTLPLIGPIAGRAVNLFLLKDGRLASPWALIRLMKLRPEIRQFQILQRSTDHYVLRYASSQPISDQTESWVRSKFQETLGIDLTFRLERVAEIGRSPTGKFMPALSEVGCHE